MKNAISVRRKYLLVVFSGDGSVIFDGCWEFLMTLIPAQELRDLEMPIPCIFLIEDDESMRVTMEEFLVRAGYAVETASSEAHAFSKLSHTDFCDRIPVVITDLSLPDVGPDFLSRLREQLPNSGLIVLTGYPSVQSAITSMNIRCLGYLTKPFNEIDLLEMVAVGIDSWLSMRKVRMQLQSFITRQTEILANSQEVLRKLHQNPTVSAQSFVSICAASAESAITGLVQMVTQLSSDAPERGKDVCSLFECPRLTAFERLTQDSINVLERTKQSFHSKELAVLRQSLTAFLNANQGRQNQKRL